MNISLQGGHTVRRLNYNMLNIRVVESVGATLDFGDAGMRTDFSNVCNMNNGTCTFASCVASVISSAGSYVNKIWVGICFSNTSIRSRTSVELYPSLSFNSVHQ